MINEVVNLSLSLLIRIISKVGRSYKQTNYNINYILNFLYTTWTFIISLYVYNGYNILVLTK